MYASTRASSSASTSASVFSLASCSSASSIGDQFEYDAPAVAPTPMMPVVKAASIHLPLRLPARPNGQRDVDWSQLALDGELAGHPVGFIIASLRAMGSELHKLAHASRVHIPAVPEMPSHLAVAIPPTTLPRPTHVLAIGSDDSSRKLLMPVHGLLWAASSPALAALSSQGDTSLDSFLPVTELHLPSALAVPLLQKWIYLASSESLLSLLLPAPPRDAVKRGSLSSLLNPTPASYSYSISTISSSVLLARTEVLHGLWQNVIALEMGDVELWRTMSGAWEILVGALALQGARRREVARGRAQGR